MFKKAIETPDYVIPPSSDPTNRATEPSKKSEISSTEDNCERTIRGIRKDSSKKFLQPPSSVLVTSQSASRRPLQPSVPVIAPTVPGPTAALKPPQSSVQLKQAEDKIQPSSTTTAYPGPPKLPNSRLSSPPQPISISTKSLDNHKKTSSKKDTESVKGGSQQKTKSRSKSGGAQSDKAVEATSLHTGVSLADTVSNQPTTATCIDWEDNKLVKKTVNLNSKKSPQLIGVQVRWILFIWGLLLCCYDVAMFMISAFMIFTTLTEPFLRRIYHYTFLITLPSGPSLVYLMLSEKVSIFWWKTHISCQLFRVVMNVYLFIDYYCIKLDEEDYYDSYHQFNVTSSTGPNVTIWKLFDPEEILEGKELTNKYFMVAMIVLGIATVLTIIFYGFAVHLYYYEKEALKKRQDKWKRRMNEAFESQGLAPDVATAISEDVISGKKCQIVMPNK